MSLLPVRYLTLSATALCALSAPASAQNRPHAGMMRYPDISETSIVFSYANDLWIAPRAGGQATPLASPPGEETFSRFSPDGKSVAFVGNYDGNRDLYTIPVAGGVPFRVTHHPAGEWLQEWTGDGKLLFATNGYAGLGRQQQLFTVPVAGGLPQALPVPYGATAAISPDGQWLAYTPHSINMRTWKRYRGGMQTDIWLFNLNTHESKRMTDWEGIDSIPMWHGQTVYYLSDMGPEHRENIWKYDVKSGKKTQVTKFADYDVKWPSIGGGAIVFQYGRDLHVLDLQSEQSKAVEITIPGDRPKLRPIREPMNDMIRSGDLSKSGKRVAVEARGDIFDLPAREGATMNLTRTSGVHERLPAFSPDGKWLAYFSDESGEYELYTRSLDGKAEVTQRTKGSKTFYYGMAWSPDSKRIAYVDKAGNIHLLTLETGETKIVDTDPWANSPGISWSNDSDWITYSKNGENSAGAIWVYQVSKDTKTQVTTGMFNDGSPAFDRKGEFLYYTSNRNFNSPKYEDVGTTFVYDETAVMLAVPLRKDVKSPLLPKNDSEEEKKDEKSDEKKSDSQPASSQASDSQPASSQTSDSQPTSAESKPAEEKKEEIKPLVIDLDGFEQRAIQLPIRNGRLGNLTVNGDGHLIYVRFDREPAIKIFDPGADEKEEKTVLGGVGGYAMSADGKKLLAMRGGDMAVVDAKADQKMDKKVPTDSMATEIDPRAEWKHIFREAWRIQRDFFYDPTMHGVDWDAVYKQYEPMLADCVSREDVSVLIREMISELNVGHAYYFGGDEESQPNVSVGVLGCDFSLEDGAYRFKRIYQGGPWDSDARNPLSEAGVNVKEGEYLLAVNNKMLDVAKDPWAAFIGLAGKTVTLTIGENPTCDDKTRSVVVKMPGGDGDLRYRAWIERNRAYVEQKSGGKVGYIYVPDTGVNGQNNLFRQFYGQIDKAALIIDERWNGGGQIPTRFIELLNRPVTNYWARRDGKDWTWPPDSHQGPKCMLINGLAGSGGDMFPWLFRFNKLGKLIGTRTWGGLVGITGYPPLIDGAQTTAPAFAFYEKDGTWGVEGHGVDPDIEVIDDPAKMVSKDGEVADPQLDAAIDLMLKEIAASGYKPPKRPAYPNRRGMGIAPEDK
ncbi:MAG: PD40 domain-containing protein [Phycisphaerales bacterium]|nr:PD40 domain-containing protein [Phycisphaerales bacterium]